MSDKRIYVVLPETVQPYPWVEFSVVQPPGRMAAQACHVVSKMRVNYSKKDGISDEAGTEPITTILLSCRDTKELLHVNGLLINEHIGNCLFHDENPAYALPDELSEGSGPELLQASAITALCTYPVDPARVQGILDYLPLWDPIISWRKAHFTDRDS